MYRLKEIIWETTLGCNLRCTHCGSSCSGAADDELSPAEAADVARQIADLRPDFVSLTGGEPLLRPDIYDIIHQITSCGIEAALITNGTLITRDAAERLRDSGITIVAISIDGIGGAHDAVRGGGVWDKVLAAIDCLSAANVRIGAITTVSKANIGELDGIYNFLVSHNAVNWQIQPALPEGRFAANRHLMLEPSEIKGVIEFSLTKNLEDRIKVYLADTFGYYTKAEVLSRMIALNSETPVLFKGCNAGIRSVGILCNGDVVGCTSIRRPEYVEGNLRHQTLAEIWNSPDSFSWRRKIKISDLGSKCQQCGYVASCLGGCTNIRLTTGGNFNSDNPLCVYANCGIL